MTEKLKIEVLIQESEHVQLAISRAVASSNGIFGIIVPAIFGVILFASTNKNAVFSTPHVGFVFAAIVSIGVCYANFLFIEAFHYMHYKYAILYPKLYEIVEIENHRNFIQYINETRKPVTWVPLAIFHLCLLIFTTVYSLDAVIEKEDQGPFNWFLVGALGFIFAAVVSSIVTWITGRKLMTEIKKSKNAE